MAEHSDWHWEAALGIQQARLSQQYTPEEIEVMLTSLKDAWIISRLTRVQPDGDDNQIKFLMGLRRQDGSKITA